MCLAPIRIYNQSKRLGYGKRFAIEVPCGQCAECKKMQQTEYYFRCYYTVRETLDKNGFIYFDTLTYDNDNLPHLSEFLDDIPKDQDYSCFRLTDYRYFMVRLRRMLEYAGYQVKDNLKIFLSSEYGTSEKGTHRPHYHILFFCTVPGLLPMVLSKYVDKAWQKGRTDGYPWQPSNYVLKHVFGAEWQKDKKYLRAICNYVAKYVAKDSSFTKVLDKRINILLTKKFGEDWSFNADAKSYRVKLKHQMDQFHRQSQGFGLAGVLYNDIDEVFETGMMKMDDKKVVRHAPLSGYLVRKLFYELYVGKDGRKHWRLNQLGIAYSAKHKLKSLDLFARRMEDWYDNLDKIVVQVGDEIEVDDKIVKVDEELHNKELDFYKKLADHLLDGRSWMDYSQYIMMYKGRVITPDSQKGISYPRLDQMLLYDLAPNDEVGIFYNYQTSTHKKIFRQKFVDVFSGRWTPADCPEEWDRYIRNGNDRDQLYSVGVPYKRVHYDYFLRKYVKQTDNVYLEQRPRLYLDEFDNKCSFMYGWNKKDKWKRFVKNDVFESDYCYTENFHNDWRNFDKLYNLYVRSLQYKNKRKQDVYDAKLEMQKRMKEQGIYVKSI